MDTLLAPDVAAYVVGGFLLLGTGVLLLFHCSSISERKRRQRVEHGEGCGNDAVAKRFFRPWRHNRKKSPLLHKFDVPAVIITPPSPLVGRLGLDDDEDSIGSSSDLACAVVVVSEVCDGEEVVTVTQESRKTSTPSCVPQDGVDVFRDFDSPVILPCRRPSLPGGSSSQSDKAGSGTGSRAGSGGSGSGAASSHSASSQDGSSQSTTSRGSAAAQRHPPDDGLQTRGRLSSNSSSSTGSSSAQVAGVDGSWAHGRTSPGAGRAVSARSVLTLSDADGDEDFFDDVEPAAMRPRLSSMEPGTAKKDFNIPVMVHSDTK